MPTAEKIRVVEQTKERYERAAGVFVTEYRGLTVPQIQNLRRELKAKGGELKVLKNTLVRRAMGDDADLLGEELLSGPTAIAFAYENETECAKVLMDFAKTAPVFVVKGGLVDGKKFDADAVKKFSELPSRDVLIAQVIGVVAAPLSNLVGVVEALYADPIRVIGAVADKVGEGGGPVEAAPESEDTESQDTPAEAEAEAPTAEESSDTE